MNSIWRSPLTYGILSVGLTLPLAIINKYINRKSQNIQPSLTITAHIGGVFSRFQLIEVDPTMVEPKIIFSKKYETQSFDSFESLFARFLSESKYDAPGYPNNAVVAISGPVVHNMVFASNVKKWGELNGYMLQNHFNLESFIFLNDYESIGYSVLKLKKNQFVQLNPGVVGIQDRKIAILGVTNGGLGSCTIIPAPFETGMRHYVWASEEGHAAFTPITELQTDYMFWVMKKQNLPYLSKENALAGPGIKHIYKFFHETRSPELEFKENLTSEEILRKGGKNEDALCRRVVDFFLDLFATEVGNVACTAKPLSGIYIVGSLLNSVKDYLLGDKLESFLELYHNKDAIKEMVEAVPLYLVTKESMALVGAFTEAQRRLIKIKDLK